MINGSSMLRKAVYSNKSILAQYT